MNIFDNLVIISFFLAVFSIFFSNFLYKKLIVCLEAIKEIRQFNEETLETIQNLKEQVSQYRISTENIQTDYRNLDESFKNLQVSFPDFKRNSYRASVCSSD